MMKFQSLIPPSFYAMVLFLGIGIFLKWNDQLQANTFLNVGYFFVLVFMILTVIEVNRSKYIDKQDKLFWTLGLIFMCLFAGMAYMLYGRKRVLGKE
ncbi:MAG: hypothetical protein IPI46_03860 [Bacteroidetes bacterium]|nr:hypothetical protein [Bacteroidota bacterium]